MKIISQQRYSVTLQDTWDTDNNKPTYDITGAVDISTNEGIEAKTDSFNLKVFDKNLPLQQNNDQKIQIRVEQRIKIYMAEGSANPKDTASNLVMNGKIDKITFSLNSNGKIWNINGINILEALLFNMRPTSYVSETASFIVGDLIDFANDNNSQNSDYLSGGISKNITTTNKTFNYYQPYKPIFQMIEELSTNEFTDDGQYIFYLDTDGKTFIWKPRPSGTVTGTITEGVDILSLKSTQSVFDVVNFVVINCGLDFNGKTIYAYGYNAASIGKMGWKSKLISYEEIATEEKNRENAGPDVDNPFGVESNYTGGNAQLRADCRAIGRAFGKDITAASGTPRWKVKIEVRGTLSYTKGDVYKLVIPSLMWENETSKELRLIEVRHNFNRSGWITTLNFEEDEDVAIAEFKRTY